MHFCNFSPKKRTCLLLSFFFFFFFFRYENKCDASKTYKTWQEREDAAYKAEGGDTWNQAEQLNVGCEAVHQRGIPCPYTIYYGEMESLGEYCILI